MRPLDSGGCHAWQPMEANQNLSLQIPQPSEIKTLRTTNHEQPARL